MYPPRRCFCIPFIILFIFWGNYGSAAASPDLPKRKPVTGKARSGFVLSSDFSISYHAVKTF